MTRLSRRTQRGSMALSPVAYRAAAIRDLFRLYANHPDFRAGLRTLADAQRHRGPDLLPLRGHDFARIEAHAETSEALGSYVAGVQTFAAKWGLDRVNGATGLDAVHRWIDLALHDPEEDGRAFGFGLPMDDLYAGVDTTVNVGEGFAWDPEEKPRADSEMPVPVRLRELYGWRMRRYVTGARTRIHATLSLEQGPALDTELDRIQDEYESLGYVFPDTEPRYADHLSRAFQRLALRRAVWHIVRDSGASQPRVYAALEAMRQRLGIDAYPPVKRKPEVNPRPRRTPY